MILLEEGNPYDARYRLEAALVAYNRFSANPFMAAVCDRIRFDLAMACAGCGETQEALGHFRRAEPRLRAFGRGDLIEKGARAIGVPVDA